MGVDVVVAVVEEDLAWTTGEEDVVGLPMVTSLRGFMRLCPGWMLKAPQERPGLTKSIMVLKAEEQMRRNFGSKGGCENTAVLDYFLLQVSNLLCMNVLLFVLPENSEEHF